MEASEITEAKPQDNAVETTVPTAEEVNTAINTAIDEAVDAVVGSGGDKADDAKEENAVVNDEPKAKEASKPNDDDIAAEQALLDRAVKAGLSVKELMEIPTHALAERMVALAEKANGISTPDNDKEDEGAGTPADDLGVALEEMEADGEYDPKILKLLRGLYTENQTLKAAGNTAAKQTFFEQQFGTLDDAVRSHVDAVRMSKVKAKFDLLEAGYKAQGAKVSREEVFKEAAQLALGDLMGRAEEERKASALEQRKRLALARPGGESGHIRGKGPATEEDVASEIWDMIK